MQEPRQLSGTTEEELWEQVQADLAQQNDLLSYHAILDQQGKAVALDIEIDLGGGFEGGSETTILSAPFDNPTHFRFALHREHFLDEIGKFFGMENIEIGDADFDRNVVVKATDESKIKALLDNQALRAVLLTLSDFTFEIELPHHEASAHEASQLVLTIDEGITDAQRLRPLYDAFFHVLTTIDQTPGASS